MAHPLPQQDLHLAAKLHPWGNQFFCLLLLGHGSVGHARPAYITCSTLGSTLGSSYLVHFEKEFVFSC